MILSLVEEAKLAFQDEDYYKCIIDLEEGFYTFEEGSDFILENFEKPDLYLVADALSMIKKIVAQEIFKKNQFLSQIINHLEISLVTIVKSGTPELEALMEMGLAYGTFLSKLTLCLYSIKVNQYLDADERDPIWIHVFESDDDEGYSIKATTTVKPKEGLIKNEKEAEELLSKIKKLCNEGGFQNIEEAFENHNVLSGSTFYKQSVESCHFLTELVNKNEPEGIMYMRSISSLYNETGCGYFFLGQYEEAINYYLKALEKGFDNQEMIEYNVWEACVEIIKGASEAEEKKKWKLFFEERFPESQYFIVLN